MSPFETVVRFCLYAALSYCKASGWYLSFAETVGFVQKGCCPESSLLMGKDQLEGFVIGSVWSVNSPQILENERAMPESHAYLPSLKFFFFFAFLFSIWCL